MLLRGLLASVLLFILHWNAADSSPPGCVNFDFERGNLYGWTKSGTAFNFQPTYGDNPSARRRGQPARMQGKWWIGTFEKRPNPRSRAGAIQGDRPTGTLSSMRFRIVGNHIDFLIGGGCNIHYTRAELVIDGRGVVLRSKGRCSETMTRRRWNVRAYIDRTGFVRLVDYGTGGWGHINFDDLRGNIRCEKICKLALGMQNRRIPNYAITASSSWDANHAPHLGRLHFNARGRLQGAWSSRYNNHFQFFQVDFRKPTKVSNVATQGRQNANQWVTQYRLAYSQDGLNWALYKLRDGIKYFRANRDRNTVVTNALSTPIRTRYIRIIPWGWHGHMSMRVEFYGCFVDRCTMPLGAEDGRLVPGSFSASSYYNHHLAPWHGRLNHRWSWSVRHRRHGEWLQVSFGSSSTCKGVATQGRQDANQWVTRYTLSYSKDGMRFYPYNEGRGTVMFRGNMNRFGIVFHRINRPFIANHVRFYPRGWYSWISMRVEIYGCPSVGLCNGALGLQNGRLKNGQITASSSWPGLYTWRARLHHAQAWCARYNNHNQWLKFDFRRPTKVIGMAIQGRSNAHQWVTRFLLHSSQDNVHWAVYRYKNNDKYFPGSRDQHSVSTMPINPAILTRYIKIQPRGWRSHICMKVEFYGCPTDHCFMPLGMQDGRITKSRLRASSMYNTYYGPYNARLQARNYGSARGGWIARIRNTQQWIQVDLEKVATLKGVATQGRFDANQYVRSYIVTYSRNGRRFVPYREGSRTRLFSANSDRYHVVTRRFIKPFKARYVRLYPKSWYSYISLRMELYGCRHGPLCNQPMGMQSGRIGNKRITASSNWDPYHAAFRARLHHAKRGRYIGSWCAKTNNRHQWLQVDFVKAVVIVRVATQGRQDYRQWVTQYYLRYALDGIHFVDYKQKNTRKYFPGNRDQNTVKSYPLVPNIKTRYIRIMPWHWYRHISMRAEFYGCFADPCKMPLGLEDYRIPSSALSASSSWNNAHGPDRARINLPNGHGRAGAWVARGRNAHQWLQVELCRPAKITGVATQGRHDAHQWVTTYTVKYSLDGKRFRAYMEYGRNKVFQANFDRYTIVEHELAPPIRAKFIRFHPKAFRSYVAMRVEIYGCYYGGARFCTSPVGMQNGRIKNRAITASSYYNHFHAPWLARLHRRKHGRFIGSWSARHNNHHQFLQVDLGRTMKITGINTQGRYDASQWVTAYYVLYSSDGMYFAKVKHWWNVVKQFQGNYDRYSVRTHAFRPALYARYVRIQPRSWRLHISMRMELYGCAWNHCDMPLGLEDGRVPDPVMTASSYNNIYDAPWNARLNRRRYSRFGGGWSPRRNDRIRFLQIDFQAMTKATRVATQGMHNANYWVTKYYIKYGKTKSRLVPYREGRSTKIFSGNYDRYIIVQHKFAKPLYGRYFRVYPVAWYSWIGLRVEFYGCVYGKRCNQPLGMQNGRIKGQQLAASSSWDGNHLPSNARLHLRRRGHRIGAWSARHNTRYQWLQVDFIHAMRVVKIATQGRQDAAQWVTQYYITYSQDGAHFAEFKKNSNRKYFTGNRDQNSIVQHRLFPRIKARFIRVCPWGWYRHISMRVEFYGCSAGRCSLPLGLEDKRITNGHFSASTYYNHHLAPWHGRLNHRWSWSSRTRNHNQWLQVSFVSVVKATGVGTQGRQDANQWVTKYIVSYSPETTNFRYYSEGRGTKVFTGNSNRHTIVYHDFVKPFSAVYVRIYPKGWYSWISMRTEIYGCYVAVCSSPLVKRLSNSKITASSEYNGHHAAWLGRLGRIRRGPYVGAWCARHNNHNQWIKFDFSRPMKITKVDTQGRHDADQWVTRFLLSSSLDGIHWQIYRFKSQDKYFQGNRDRNSVVTQAINPPILARFVRLHPRGWRSHISMRVEFYGCRADPCDVPLGMQDGRVTKGMLTASSMYNHYYGPWSARLQARNHGSTRGGWIAKYRNTHQFLQIDLGITTRVKRIATQGRYDANQWVKSYTVSYSNNGVRFYPVKHGRRVKVFQGNMERNLVVFHKFRPSLKTRYVRIHPRTWYSYISMRVELYGCRLGPLCNRPMGMQSGRLKNHMITASSIWDVNHGAYLARLHNRRRGNLMGAWSSKYNNRYQWLQVYFGGAAKIIRISTQGRQDANQWVTQYYITHSLDRVHFSEYKERNSRKYFTGNRDRNTLVSHPFIPAIRGQYIRVHPWGWHAHISMRAEFYGCRIDRFTMPLGMEDYRVLPGHLRASSSYNYNHGPDRARLNIYNSHGRTGAWVAKYRNTHQFLQIDLRELSIIKGIATQGRREAHQWVTKYQMSYSRFGARFKSYVSYGRVKVFIGNYDIYHTVSRKILPAIRARYIRIHPKGWRSYIAMRVELYGGRLKENFCDTPVGLQSGRIKNSQITAFSQWNKHHAPWLARLHRTRRGPYIGSWSSRHNNHHQWLQIDFRRAMKITGIATQGRQDAVQWVTAYYIYYGYDGVFFSKVRYWWNYAVKTFQGNRDQLSVQTHPINPAIYCRYVRIIPRGWRAHISMRLELYGSPWNHCDMPLGLEDKRVHNKMMRASSYYNYWCGPWSGRLNGRRHGRYGGAWCAKRRDRHQWLQIDFGALTKVYRIASQGRQNSAQWVKSYSLSYSKNGYKFITYKEGGRTKIFPANYDQHVIVRHRLRHVILGRYFRFHPITWYSWISMRVELYGCVVGARCNRPLGMQNGRIRAAQLTASSSWDRNHAPNRGRLHLHRVGAKMGAWCARHNNRLQWLQVNFLRPTRVVKFATQGRQDARQWVTQYYLTFSQDGAHYAEYKENSNRKYFQGNRDQNSIVQHRLFPRIKAQYIEIHPWGWYRHISMRVEFYGCAEDRCVMPLGLEDKRITDGHLTASTYYNHHLSPWHGRLNHRWSWSVRLRRVGQWFQVNFVELMRIKGVATQGRQDTNQWVRSYTVSYSTDGMNFVSYKEGRTTKVFDGNTDRHSIVYHQFTRPFTAIHVRFYPRAWYSWISMRAEVYGCSAAPCNKPLGLQNRRLPDSRITASSEWNHFHAARLGRLGQVKHGRFVGAWCAKHNNHLQWFKVDFGRPMKITKVATQGRQDTNQWVTSFYLSSSQDNVHWEMYKFRSAYKLFQANRDQNSIMKNAINPPILARYVKLNPRGWYRHISMRIEYYGCIADRCDVPLGIRDGRVTRAMFSASSMYNHHYGPWSARLHAQNRGSARGGWIAKYNNRHQFLQVDLGTTSRVKRIATQARYDANQWVKSYTLSYSNNGVRFIPYRHGKRVKIFQGNTERYFVVVHRLRPTIKARYIRVHPRTWYGHISLRMELYGCRLGVLCNRPMGMQSGRIKNHKITAASSWDRYHGPYLARLNRRRRGRYMGAWSAKYNNHFQWLQCDFGKATKIIKMSIQGRQDANQWVTQYYVTRSLDAVHFMHYKERNSIKYFTGNRDQNTVVTNSFLPILRCRYVRVHPRGWYRHISMRVEFYGCLTDRCVMPLGMEDYRILSGHLRASSSYNYNHGPDRARLNIFNSHGRTGAWVARHRNTHQYLQIDLRQLSIIKGIATQGRREAHQWVTSYSLSFSRFGVRFKAYESYGRVKIFRGNYDIFHTVGHKIMPAIRAQFVRIHPRSWRSYIAMRVELYGCRLRERFYDSPVGIQNGRIKNSAMTASSQWDANHAAWLARLHRIRRGRFMGAWSSRHNNHNQWLQIYLWTWMKVVGIATQGRHDADQWVTAYYVYYSSDGVNFAKVKHWWNYVKTFQGNRDRMSVQTHPFDPPVYGRFIRIIPRGWRLHISMRLELYGGPWNRCDMPLGVEDGRVPDPLMRASSFYNYYCGPFNARLNRRRYGRQGGAWCAKRRDRRQWLQIDFGALTKVCRVATQGRQNSAQWVKSYYITYSRNGYKFIPYREGRRTKIFQGNYDQFIIVRHRLARCISARYFRIHPVTWYSWISMRVEFYGCVVGPRCNKPLGMQNGRIKANQLSASSSWDRNHAPNNGRLHLRRVGARMGAWCARHNNRLQWYQVDFGRPTRVVKFAIQGRQDARQWVTQCYLSYSQDGIHYAEFKENSNRKVRVVNKFYPR